MPVHRFCVNIVFVQKKLVIVICFSSEFFSRELLEHLRDKEMFFYTFVSRCNRSQTLFTRMTPTIREVLHGTVPGAGSKAAACPAGSALARLAGRASARSAVSSPVRIYKHPRPLLRTERVLATLPYRCRCIQCWPELYSPPYELEDLKDGEKNTKDENGCGSW